MSHWQFTEWCVLLSSRRIVINIWFISTSRISSNSKYFIFVTARIDSEKLQVQDKFGYYSKLRDLPTLTYLDVVSGSDDQRSKTKDQMIDPCRSTSSLSRGSTVSGRPNPGDAMKLIQSLAKQRNISRTQCTNGGEPRRRRRSAAGLVAISVLLFEDFPGIPMRRTNCPALVGENEEWGGYWNSSCYWKIIFQTENSTCHASSN